MQLGQMGAGAKCLLWDILTLCWVPGLGRCEQWGCLQHGIFEAYPKKDQAFVAPGSHFASGQGAIKLHLLMGGVPERLQSCAKNPAPAIAS